MLMLKNRIQTGKTLSADWWAFARRALSAWTLVGAGLVVCGAGGEALFGKQPHVVDDGMHV